MAQQTKRSPNRSTTSTRKRASSNGRKRGTTNDHSTSQSKSRTPAQKTSGSESLLSKLKTPAIATGAAAAGLAGGLALAGRRSPKKLLGVRLPGTAAPTSQNLAEAAKQIGSFGERVGELATEIRTVRQGVGNARADEHKRSPIEVVLQGLTSRAK